MRQMRLRIGGWILGSEDAGLAAAAESGKAVESERRRKPPEPPLIGMEQRWSQPRRK